MKISKREKILVYMLGLVVVAFLYYQFGYTTLTEKVAEKDKQQQEIQTKYEQNMQTIESMDKRKAKIKILNAKITDEATLFYPVISQDKIILEIDKLITESGLEGGMTFQQVEVKDVSVQKKSDKGQDLPESSMQSLVDQYINKYKDNKNEDVVSGNSNTEVNSPSKNDTSNANNSEATDTAKSKAGNTITQLQLNVDFNGSYEKVVKFLESLRKYNKKIPVYSINMSTKSLDEVKGSVNMMIYAIPKIDDELGSYLNWTLNNTYGKNQVFTVGSSVGTGIKSAENTSDFMASVKSINSDLPTFIMGKSNDTVRSTYVYDDSDSEIQAEMVITKVNDKYYYKYKTNNGSIPANYNGNGNQFVPNGENIELTILSEHRGTSNDNSGMKLKIINNTNKLVNVNINGDDPINPRVSIDGDSKNINIVKK